MDGWKGVFVLSTPGTLAGFCGSCRLVSLKHRCTQQPNEAVMEELWVPLGSGSNLASRAVSLLVPGLPRWCGVRGLAEANQCPHLSLLPDIFPGTSPASVISTALSRPSYSKNKCDLNYLVLFCVVLESWKRQKEEKLELRSSVDRSDVFFRSLLVLEASACVLVGYVSMDHGPAFLSMSFTNFLGLP